MDAKVGLPSNPLDLSLTGTYSNSQWTITIASTNTQGWQPFQSVSGLTFNLNLTGTLTWSSNGSVTYDFEAGSNSTSATPLLSWQPATAVVIAIDCVAFVYGMPPGSCAKQSFGSGVYGNDPTLILTASASIAGSSGIDVGVDGAIDLKTGAVTLTLDPNFSNTINIVQGLSIQLNQVNIQGGISQAFSFSGIALASVLQLGLTAQAELYYADGQFVLALTNVNLSSLGVQLPGYFAYSSGAVTGFDTNTSTYGKINLSAGFNAVAKFTIPSAVASVLSSAGFNLSLGDTIDFSASWSPGSSPTFQATLQPPKNMPFLVLPGGTTLNKLVVTLKSGNLEITVTGSIPVPNSPSANVDLTVVFNSDGSFSGTASVTGLTLFGQTVNLEGTLNKSASGGITYSISTCNMSGSSCVPGPLPGPFTPVAGLPIELKNVDISLGSDGFNASGDISFSNAISLNFNGSVQGLDKWSVSVSESVAQSWTPVPGITLSPQFSGSLTDSYGEYELDVIASGANNQPLITLGTNGISVSINQVELSNGTPPSYCSSVTPGQFWLSLSGGLNINLSNFNSNINAQGCVDLETGSFEVQVTLSNLGGNFFNGAVSIAPPTLTIQESSGSSLDVSATTYISVSLPSGGSIGVGASIYFEGSGCVVCASTHLSNLWGNSSVLGNNAYICYSSADITNFNPGWNLGNVDLSEGVNIVINLNIPSWANSGLQEANLVPGGTSFTAIANIDSEQDVYTFKVYLNFGSGISLFNQNNTSLVLNNAYLFMQIAFPGPDLSFGVGLDATLDVPPTMPNGSASQVAITGQLTVALTGGSVSVTLGMSIGNCTQGATTGAWQNAFGISGLVVQCLSLQAGFTPEPPFVTVWLYGDISGLPSGLANIIGYQQGAPIIFAFNLDPFLLDLQIGTQGSTTPALEPLEAMGLGSDLEIYFAQLYISPEGATINSQYFAPGLTLAFDAKIFGVSIDVYAGVGFDPFWFKFKVNISQITLGPLTVGPIDLEININPSQGLFAFKFKGSFDLGPGEVSIGPDLKIGGYLNGGIEVEVSTKGFEFYIWGGLGIYVKVWESTKTCYYSDGVPYPCDYQWVKSGFQFESGKTGFGINSDGITLCGDGDCVTFGWSGKVTSGSSSSYLKNGKASQFELVSFEIRSKGEKKIPIYGFIDNGDGSIKPLDVSNSQQPVPDAVSSSNGVTVIGLKGSVKPFDAYVEGSKTVVGAWSATGNTNQAHEDGVSARLQNGNILVAGGTDGKQLTTEAEIYNAKTNTMVAAANMPFSRIGASAAVLKNGYVLVADGLNSAYQATKDVEAYDPSTNQWIVLNSIKQPRSFFQMVTLPNGNVLALGGVGSNGQVLSSAEIYDNSTGQWNLVKNMPSPRAFGSAVLLANGSVAIVGGQVAANVANESVVIYNPQADSYAIVNKLPEPMLMTNAITMSNNKVLIVGGTATALVFDPITNQLTETGPMIMPVSQTGLVNLFDGNVLAVGGSAGGYSTAILQVYDPATNQWMSGGTMAYPVSNPSVEQLANGNIFVASGFNLINGNSQVVIKPIYDLGVYSPVVATESAKRLPNHITVVANVSGGSLGALWEIVIALACLLALATLFSLWLFWKKRND